MLSNVQSHKPRLLFFRDEPTLRRFCTHCGPMFKTPSFVMKGVKHKLIRKIFFFCPSFTMMLRVVDLRIQIHHRFRKRDNVNELGERLPTFKGKLFSRNLMGFSTIIRNSCRKQHVLPGSLHNVYSQDVKKGLVTILRKGATNSLAIEPILTRSKTSCFIWCE